MINEIIFYLLKVSLGLAIISLSYLVFRNDSRLELKRYYLLSGIIASWIFPLIRFPELININRDTSVAIQAAALSVEPTVVTNVSPTPVETFNWMIPLVMVYSIGLLIILFRNLSLVFIWGRKQGNKTDSIVYTGSDHVFTLFRWIFLPEKLKDKPGTETIILHEKAHINQLHFIDLLIVEFTTLLTWFNPFTWFLSKMVRENHEHLADREVLASGINPVRYRAQLINSSLGINYFRLGNQFSNSLTKKRFKMMKKTKSKSISILKYILVIPLISLALVLFTGSKSEAQDGKLKGKVYFSDTGRPAPGASVIIQGTSNGTVTDNKGDFELKYEGDPVIVISYLGYKTVKKQASAISGSPIGLDPGVFEVKLDNIIAKKPGVFTIRQDMGEDKDPPVILVDGVKVDDIQVIEPEDIESVTVIKDQSNELVQKYDAKGGLIMIVSRNPGTKEASDEMFVVVEDMPEFPGGLPALKGYIYDKLVYPEEAVKENIEGAVTVEFIVNTDGELEDIKVVESSYKGFNDPAINVFKSMPKWKPGSQRGKKVRVKLQVPVEFKLNG